MMAVITATLFASLEAMREGWGPLAAALVTTGLAVRTSTREQRPGLAALRHLSEVRGLGWRAEPLLEPLFGYSDIGG